MRLIGNACFIVGHNPQIATVTIVTNRRLTDDELFNLRRQATSCNIDIVMAGDGIVIVRRPRPLRGADSEWDGTSR